MKTTICLTLPATALFALALNLHSQAPVDKSPMQALQAMKARNQELIEKQKQTLQKLDEIEKDAAQLKIFGRRT